MSTEHPTYKAVRVGEAIILGNGVDPNINHPDFIDACTFKEDDVPPWFAGPEHHDPIWRWEDGAVMLENEPYEAWTALSPQGMDALVQWWIKHRAELLASET